jgi:glycosyltransferase involved in cell wall biosynthesis
MTGSPRRIFYLASAANIHTKKWASHFAGRGYDVHILSLHAQREEMAGVSVHYLGRRSGWAVVPRWRYLLAVSEARSLLQRLRPQILHAQYAGGYGLLGSLTGFHPYVISVWGSEVLTFPRISPVHRALINFNIRRADYVCSTSQYMAGLTQQYAGRKVIWTPFGVDCTEFTADAASAQRDDGAVTIGTVKALDKGYGIEHLIAAFAALRGRLQSYNLRLLIVGEGPEHRRLERIAHALGVDAVTEFTGWVPHHRVPEYLRRLSIYVAPSVHEESFGVAVLEASACAVPVVVSRVGGMPEVVQDQQTGFLVPPGDEVALADALERLVTSQELRRSMGAAGRRFVLEHYAWDATARIVEDLYDRILNDEPAAVN